MVPKDSSGSTETNGDAHSAGRGNLKPKRRTSSSGSASLTEEELDASLRAIDDISKILRFALGYISEIDEVKKVFDLNIEQERQIEKYKDTVNYLAFRKNEEMARLMKENETYEANLQQFELGRKELERERASIDGKRIAMKSDMQKEKEEEIQVVKRDVSEKATAKLERIRNKFEEKIKAMEMEKKELKDANKALEEEKAQAQSKLNEQREDFELDKRAVQTYTKKLESDLRQAKALPLLSPQPPQFYVDGFRELSKRISDVALNEFESLPEDLDLLDNDAVREELCKASGLFTYPLLSCESDASTFLRIHAIQNFICSKVVSIIQRPFFAEPSRETKPQSGPPALDFILDAISENQSPNPSQELLWRLFTTDKLDRLDSHNHSAVSTKPNGPDIVQAILDQLCYFRNPSDQQLHGKLTVIADMAIQLWSALRKDKCQIDFDHNPSLSNWEFVRYEGANTQTASAPPSITPRAELPSKSFVLFPRITAVFEPDGAEPQILHKGVALSCDSPVFQEGLQEIEDYQKAKENLKRGFRRKSTAQSSPVLKNHPGMWPASHTDFH